MRGNPFKHAIAMFAAIAAAKALVDPVKIAAAMAKIDSYVSRGKGRGKAFDKTTHYRKSTYFPPEERNGKRECARRRRSQIERGMLCVSESKPHNSPALYGGRRPKFKAT